MQSVRGAGLDVVALADHNDATWIDPMQEAGERAGVVVFPGVEVTTASGADGIHLIIIGALDRTTADFEEVLARVCGFGGDHPRFDPVTGNPSSAPKTVLQILDGLSDHYVVIAPHAFNDNGIASANTVKGDLRWKALHHERLSAIDVGDVRGLADDASFHTRFANRELEHFPCLSGLAFVSTSDAYDLDRFGQRFTWIRMAEPSLEGLRQAFLDREARIVCDWDEHHPAAPQPNEIRHAWVEKLSMTGLTTSRDDLEVEFDSRLTVVIGGRGSGKSTIVSALRLLYGDFAGLPASTSAEFDEMKSAVFGSAQLQAQHHLAYSGELQAATWNDETGALTARAAGQGVGVTNTDFKVRVISQKELYDRAASSSEDPAATSRNLLALVDDALAAGSAAPGGPAGFTAVLEEAQTAWISAARAYQTEVEATGQRALVSARVEELRRQVAAFDSPENQARRESNDARIAERVWLESSIENLRGLISQVQHHVEHAAASPLAEPQLGAGAAVEVREDLLLAHERLSAIERVLRATVGAAVVTATEELGRLPDDLNGRPWQTALDQAIEDSERYRNELAELGLDPEQYERVRVRLTEEVSALERIDQRLARLPEHKEAAESTWRAVLELFDERRRQRSELLDQVADRSELLRFRLTIRRDAAQWTRRVRDLLNLRADGFLEDVPALAEWLWRGPEQEQIERWDRWRAACVSGDLSELARLTGMRAAWRERIENLDAILRARVGAETADDVVTMEFLREGGDATVEEDWKPLTAGSPG